eukprot:g5775.t1
MSSNRPKVGVGVFCTNPKYPGCILLGVRKSVHGNGTYALPGGHVEFAESWEETGRRETLEETGQNLSCIRIVTIDNSIEKSTNYHYVTVFVIGITDDEPKNLEPDKCKGWGWYKWDSEDFPKPLFKALENFRAAGFNPFTDVANCRHSPPSELFSVEESLSATVQGNRAPVSVVTGASRGIGKGFMDELVQAGFLVVGVARNQSSLTASCDEVNKRKWLHASSGYTERTLRQSSPGYALPFTADVTKPDEVQLLSSFVEKILSDRVSGKIAPGVFLDLLIQCAGTFKWDKDKDANSLITLNFESKVSIFNALQPFLALGNQYRSSRKSLTKQKWNCGVMVLIGSQAGKPGFKKQMEEKEGKGATDGEAIYISSMKYLHNWSEELKCLEEAKEKNGIEIVLCEPGLVDTNLVRNEFSDFGIDWTNVMKPDEYAKSVLRHILIKR